MSVPIIATDFYKIDCKLTNHKANKKPAEAGFLPSHPWEFSD